MPANITAKLLKTFGLLSKASARKLVYSQRAGQTGRPEVGHLLRVIAASESVQARRLFNSLRGKIDISEQYLSAIFEREIAEIMEVYTENLSEAQQEGNKAMIQILSQLRAAERRIMSFYAKATKDVKVDKDEQYFVCQFCGYINTDKPPEICPVCGASKSGFMKIH